MADFDRDYQGDEALFGAAPESVLERFVDELCSPVLVIGAGQGRNACYLAGRGLQVVAIDPSAVAVDTLRARLPSVDVRQEGFESFRCERPLGGVLVFGLLPVLERSQIGVLAEKLRVWTRPGGLIFLTGFTTLDPAYEHNSRSWASIGERSYRSPGGVIRTYLAPGELPRLVGGFEVLHHHEGLGPEHRHGDGPVERHGLAELVARRV